MSTPLREVVFVHSYCLALPKPNEAPRLSSFAMGAIQKAITESKIGGKQREIIVATAYKQHHETEELLQSEEIEDAGIPDEMVHFIGPIRNSYDEAKRAFQLARELGAYKLIVIAERDHANRSRKIFRHLWPDQVQVIPFKTPCYEFTLEPSTIKKVRSGFRLTWFLWNFAFGLLSPSFMFRQLEKAESRRAKRRGVRHKAA